MSLRACKEVINENLRIAMKALMAEIAGFEKMFGKPGFKDEFYTEGIAIDRELLRNIESARRSYAKLRNDAAEALDE